MLEILAVVGVRDIALKRHARGCALYALGLSSSLFLLYLAMKTMEMSIVDTAYTGIGVVGTVVTGILFWGDKKSHKEFASLSPLVASIVALKTAGYRTLMVGRPAPARGPAEPGCGKLRSLVRPADRTCWPIARCPAAFPGYRRRKPKSRWWNPSC
ncbi:hypothetical protein DXT74_16295 [Chromobacterium sp. Rain0013]|nr:hypothetical protein DXT74_16295 [Chromobacterium sp. Rain0013]